VGVFRVKITEDFEDQSIDFKAFRVNINDVMFESPRILS